MKSIEKKGSVRIDLVGGTLDLWPINLILKNSLTINFATNLMAKVVLDETSYDGIEIKSLDYNETLKIPSKDLNQLNIYEKKIFKKFNFIVQIIDYFKIDRGISLTLSSGIPPGTGLGGSWAMGVTLFQTLEQYLNQNRSKETIARIIQDIEARMLDAGPAGYQDYLPALHGGILGIVPSIGEIEVRQLYSPKLKNFIEKNISLIYSGESRYSGFNNWEIYQRFFNKDVATRSILQKIANISFGALQKIETEEFDELIKLVGKEGEERNKLSEKITPPVVKELINELSENISDLGYKMCGAGGGGCFLLIHDEKSLEMIAKTVQKYGMKKIDFAIEKPL